MRLVIAPWLYLARPAIIRGAGFFTFFTSSDGYTIMDIILVVAVLLLFSAWLFVQWRSR